VPVYTTGTADQLEKSRISGFSLFENGIEPKWEDETNIKGSELQFLLNLSPAQQNYPEFVNPFWEEVVLNLISGHFPESDQIAGVRLSDKSKGEGLVIRLEVWLKTVNGDPRITTIKNFVFEELLKKNGLPSTEDVVKFFNHKE